MLSLAAFLVLSAAWGVASAVDKSNFVSTNGTGFSVNGSEFRFIGTNVYWLQALDNDEASHTKDHELRLSKAQDIDNVLGNISLANITVVRTWAFNDVPQVPENGTWFQVLNNNGTATLNMNETTGLPKLDRIFDMAAKHNITILPVLTNNYNPIAGDNLTDPDVLGLGRRDVLTGNALPRNYLVRCFLTPMISLSPSRRATISVEWQDADAYVRAFNGTSHDEFYTNPDIIAAFENYTVTLVKRYVNRTNLLAWELANDPRCNSSIAASPSCNTTIITLWHSRIATLINETDPNHLVSAGTAGFFCADCPKSFPPHTVPPPQTSPTPDQRRNAKTMPKPLTNKRILAERKESRKKNRALKMKKSPPAEGVRVRGRWIATPTRRQEEDQGVGSAFDGSTGVDSEDILSIPQIGFSSFQLFPDQNQYAPNDPSLSAFNNTLEAGLNWIIAHGESATMFGKPIVLSGFGLVTQNAAPFFVPFNTTIAPFANSQVGNISLDPGVLPFGVTDAQQDDAYSQWLQQGILSGLAGIIQYQWGQGNLTAGPANASIIAPSISENGVVSSNGVTTQPNSTGISPQDGYSFAGQGESTVQGTLSGAANQFVPDS
ncbi:Glycoside hydrolase family 5 protein [Mycena chlorophos]|uniref:mannan endo-1,4-beta-mannosidase n=1 Tax=Mycena chlorophos TaxID=658473 RepID=A0A8H6TTV7_MYCCL|nr:Glycoside hydrolase family 5 protein [Mycena chlorophos]